jgi:hypothetical protein
MDISLLYVLLNKPFKNHLKQLYYKWFLEEGHVVTQTRTIKTPDVEPQQQIYLETAVKEFKKFCMSDEIERRMRKQPGMLEVNMTV